MQNLKTYLINHINELNEKKLIKKSEKHYKGQIIDMIDELANNFHGTKFILVSGPSSAGKTTTSYILKNEFNKKGINAKVISLDNFFLEREETPLLPNGDKDYDSIKAVDWELFEKCMHELLVKKVSVLPVYDFIKGKKHFNNPPTTLLENEIILIEGLHALNPLINKYIPNKFSVKTFVCPQSEFEIDNEVKVNIFELRLMRRLVRDIRTRGISPAETLKAWKNVREAENKYVLPFMKEANFVIDTTHEYEPCIYKTVLENLLVNHENSVQALLNELEPFKKIKPKKVPEDSLLKEFVG